MKLATMVKNSLVLLPLLLAACGGGGGSDAPSAITYSGASTQATVTTANARALSADAVAGGQAGASFGTVGVATEGTGGAPAASRLQALATLLGGAVERLTPTDADKTVAVAGAMAQNTVPGAGGGSASYTITLNETTGAFSGTMVFAAYRDQQGGPAVSGSVSFSGAYNQATQSFTTFTISFPAITMTEGSVIIAMGGSITTDKPSNRVVVSLVLKDSFTNKTFWVKDFTYSMTAPGTLTLNGTYYDPVHGYVTISTVTPLAAGGFEATPTAGQLLFTGVNGTRARLTFTATGSTVAADNGNGTFVTVP